MKDKPKDRWDKADVLLRTLGVLLTPLSVALVGFLGSRYLEQRQADETNMRLYAEIMSTRETADTALRQQMFNSIIKTFLDGENPGSEGERPEEQVLAVELLAYNFHDALDIGPLFKHVQYEIERGRPDVAGGGDELNEITKITDLENRKLDLQTRLERVAREVTGKQIATLEDVGAVRENLFFFSELDDHPEGVLLVEEVLSLSSPAGATPLAGAAGGERGERRFSLWALQTAPERKEVKIRLEVWETGAEQPEADLTFWVGYFDFPMIDNTRLARGERAAVVLRNWAEESARVALVYFPGSRASLKEKPYYDEVVDELVRTQRRMGKGNSL
jgi:hypothetical protein